LAAARLQQYPELLVDNRAGRPDQRDILALAQRNRALERMGYPTRQTGRECAVVGAEPHGLAFREGRRTAGVRHASSGIEERQPATQTRNRARQVAADAGFDMAYAKFAHCHIGAVPELL